MKLALLIAILGLALGLVSGGSLKRLTATQFVLVPLVFVALALEVGSFTQTGTLALGLMLAGNVVVAIFMIINRALPGLPVAGIGLLLNVIVISANGAMPVSVAASSIAQLPPPEPQELTHEPLTEASKLPWLADVFGFPPPLGTVVSPGDVLLAGGIGFLIYRQTRGEPGRKRRLTQA